jgi:hypothetical protein
VYDESAGPIDASRKRHRLAPAACAVAAALAAGCAGRGERPTVLADGSRTESPRVELEGISEPAVSTKVEVRHTRTLRPDSAARSCLRAHDSPAPDERYDAIFERVGVESSSVTFASASGLHACDGAHRPREAERPWCGVAFGVIRRGRLDDPRLDVAGCRNVSGDPLAFVWVSPGPGARYVAVSQHGYAEVYEPAGDLPIRIATSDGVEVDGSRATFRLSEHDGRGRLLRRYELDAVPAG